MKKFLFLAAALLALGISTACADSDRPIDVAQLPQKAQQFIQKHFAGEKVALAKVERDFLEVRYEVIFTDGAKAEFYKDGEWKEVDCRYSSVPAAVIPRRSRSTCPDTIPMRPSCRSTVTSTTTRSNSPTDWN